MRTTNAEAIERDTEVLRDFVGIYCRAKHGLAEGALCEDCRGLLDYAIERRRRCPQDPKPKCSDCRTHCYRPDHRAKIREVMRYAGMRSLGRGGLGKLLGRFFRGNKAPSHLKTGGSPARTPGSLK